MDKRKEYDVFDSSRMFLCALFIPQLIAFLVALFIVIVFKSTEGLSSSPAYLIIGTLLSQVCFALVYFVFNKKKKIDFLSASKLNFKLEKTNVILCVFISIVCVLGLFNFISIFDVILEKLGFAYLGSSLPINNFGWFVLNILLLGILPAIFEELIFRGVIFNGLRKKGFWFATLISSALFALVHLSIWQSVYPFIMGIILCLVAEKTGSTVYSMIVHFCNNFIVLLISYISEIRGAVPSALVMNSISKAFMAVFVAVVSLFTIWGIIKYFKKEKQDNPEEIAKNPLDKNEKKQIIIAFASAIVVWLIYTLV